MTRIAAILGGLLCLAGAGCGGSSHPSATKIPAPQRVCAEATRAARHLLGTVTMQITSRDPVNIECRLQGPHVRADVVAQAATQAWTEYETFTVHQVQAYAGEGNTASSEAPHNISIEGAQASWVPALHELVATNGTESRAGSYVTVTLAGPGADGRRAVAVARTVSAAVLSVAPRGSSPGPPPS